MWEVAIAVFGLWHELLEEKGFPWWEDTCLYCLACLWEQGGLEMVDPKFISDICEIKSHQTSLTGKQMTFPSNSDACTLGKLQKRAGS